MSVAVVVWSGTEACTGSFELSVAGTVLGRDLVNPSDDLISGQHVRLTLHGDRILITDLGRHGTAVNSEPLVGSRMIAAPAVVRIGRTILVIDSRAGIALVNKLASIMEQLAPGRAMHASVVERALLVSRWMGTDLLLTQFRADVYEWNRSIPEGPLRADYLLTGSRNLAVWAIQGLSSR